MKKGLVYYTDNNPDPYLLEVCRANLKRCISKDFDVVSVSSEPVDLGRNFIINDIPRGPLQIFKKILKGVTESKADTIFMIEHDILYHPSHFDFEIPDRKHFWYNRNRYAVDPVEGRPTYGKGVFYHTDVISLLVADRDLLIDHYSRVVDFNEKNGWRSRYGYSPPKALPKDQRIGRSRNWMGDLPNLDIRHGDTYTRVRMTKDQFRSERSCRGWTETYDIPFWGKITPWSDFLRRVHNGSIIMESKENL